MNDPAPDLTGRVERENGPAGAPDEDRTPLPEARARELQRGRLHRALHAHPVLALTTKIVVTVVGTLVFLAGVIMIFTPGQGILAIVLGLAILATEYAWAERWLRAAKDKAAQARRRAEEMDPRVRRRRLLLAGAATLVVLGAVVVYLATYGWPAVALDGWERVQSLAGWVPDLPGM